MISVHVKVPHIYSSRYLEQHFVNNNYGLTMGITANDYI